MYEDYDELDEMEEIPGETQEVLQEETEESAEQTEESTELTEGAKGSEREITFGGVCDESFWKGRADEYYADGNMSKYKECMEKAAAAAIS